MASDIDIKRGPIEGAFHLSPMQEGMLFHTLYAKQPGVDITQILCLMAEEINVSAFESAWQRVAERHSILRASFHWDGAEKPQQRIHRQVKIAVAQKDWRRFSMAEQANHLEGLLSAERRQGFELAVPPLLRLVLIRLGDASFQLVWTFHHLLLDARSFIVLFKDLFALYETELHGTKLELTPVRPYRDFIEWLSSTDCGKAEHFWREKLKGFTTPTPIPIVHTPPKELRSEEMTHGELEIKISEAVTTALRSLASEHQLTLNTLIQGTWALLLSRYSGEEDVIFGTVRAGRHFTIADADSMVGLFINTLPMRVRISPEMRLLPWFQQLREQAIIQREFEHTPLTAIQSWSEVPRGRPLFETILNVQDPSWDATLRAQGGDWSRRLFGIRSQSNYPLAVDVTGGAELLVKILYDRSRFEDKAIARMLGHIKTLLDAIAANPDQCLSLLPLLTSMERQQLLIEWNKTHVDYRKDKCVHQLFEAQAERTPHALAVACGGRQLNYEELNQRANQLAHYLQSLGVGPEVLVGVFMERSLEMVVGLLGILKAGGAYVPMDPAYPKERLAYMLEETRMPAVLTQSALLSSLPARHTQIICLDAESVSAAQPASGGSANPLSGSTASQLAYIIYTSGSTGWPKGVEIQHDSLLNLITWHQRVYNVNPADRATQVAGPAFDATVWELWPYLTAGASIHIPDEETRLSPRKLLAWFAQEKITLSFVPTPLAEEVLDEPIPERLALQVLLTGGDKLHRRPNEATPFIVINHYGPTENTVVSTWARIPAGPDSLGAPPIGRPITNTHVYVLDRYLNPVPVGVPGELYVGGASLARGYHRQPELTLEKFVSHPFNKDPAARLYKTGDRVRYLDDGNLEFLGRMDQQIKIRGHRMEAGEIECVLAQHPTVREAVVLAHEDARGETQLVAYVITRIGQTATTASLREFLKQKLPDYMVPAACVFLDTLPLTPNGKVDRTALPMPDLEKDLEKTFVAPRTPTEEMLAGIWAEVLHRDEVGIHHNFFELGGHSLLATQVMSRVHGVFQLDVPLHELFDAPTVAELAEKIDAARQTTRKVNSAPLQPAQRQGELPLSFAQERLWFLEQLEPGQSFNNIPAVIRLSGDLNFKALAEGLSEIVRRQKCFRTIFTSAKGRPVAFTTPVQPLDIPVVDLAGLNSYERESEVQRLTTEEARQPFDLTQSPLLRVKLLRLAAEEHLLLINMHHIISDGWSMGVFYRELTLLYEAFSRGLPTPLAELPIDFSDFAHWQRQWLQNDVLEQQLTYWKQQLGGHLPVLDLPTDRPRPAVQTYRGATKHFALPTTLCSALKALSRREDVTLFMLLLAAFQTLLHRYSGQEDIIVGSPMAGRTRSEVESLVGLFLNTLAFRTTLSGDITFRELLQRVRQVALEAYAHQDLPFEKLVENLSVERDLSRSPVFQVMFVLQNAPLQPLALAGLQLTPLPLDSGTAKFDLTLVLEERADGLGGYVEYNTDLFEAATIVRVLGHFQTLLEGIAAHPDERLATLPLLTTSERQQLLVEWNDTRAEYPKDHCIHQLFEAQTAKTPNAVAVVFEEQQLTYAELNRQANRLAHHLQSLGVGPETRVAICMKRSLEMIVSLVAIHKAGGCYVPLDPAYPKDRLSYMLEDSQAPVLLTQDQSAEGMVTGEAQVVFVDRLPTNGTPESHDNPSSGVTPDNIAYVIYTSGSTGKPKGVMVRHRNAVSFFTGMDERLGREPGVWLAVTSISFDISVLELFWTLTRGFKVVLQSEEGGFRAAEPRHQILERKIDFSLFYFASDAGNDCHDKYRLLIEGAKFADTHGFTGVWTPERHFHPFGGLYPNPALTGAALAMVTERLQIRAGSVVLPLHHPVRVAEEWSMVDNLSKGRAAISIASGWHANDFVLAPDRYATRKEIMWRELETIRKLWRGEPISLPGCTGEKALVKIYPQPIQRELPIWMTSSGDPETFREAGEMGLNLLTHLSGQSIEQLAAKIAIYRAAWRKHGHAGNGHLSLMLHTFVGPDPALVWETVRQPLWNYLKTYRELSKSISQPQPSTDSLAKPAENHSEHNGNSKHFHDEIEAMLNDAVERYFKTSGLFGTPEVCLQTVERLKGIGVDEIACLPDFGIATDTVLHSLQYLDVVRQRSNPRRHTQAPLDYSIPAQLTRHGVTHFQCTPSLAGMLLQEPSALEALRSLKKLLLGGEAFPPALAEQIKVSGEILNMYGPTETTVWSTTCPVNRRGACIPIGRPIANTEIYIVDRHLQPMPIGVPGELLIGGAGVVRGYLNRPELTADRFIHHPFKNSPGAKLYRTGDLARYLPDGNIEFLGRLDHQIKLRGFRIELGEIEMALQEFPNVRESVVVLRDFSAGDKRLTAYLVPERDMKLKVPDLRRFLKGKLPDYMVPSAFVILEKLPLTPNGKIDRKALPEPEGSRAATEATYTPAQTNVEKRIAAVWQDLLHVEKIGLHDNFFDLGGHSLLVVEAHARLCEELKIDMPIIKLFQYSTINALTKFLGEEKVERVSFQKVRDRAARQRVSFTTRPATTIGIEAAV